MRFVPQLAIVAASSLALSACGGAGGGNTDTRDFVRIVGSSTVYPFATAVAEAVAKTGIKSPVIESTGTGSGIKLFCAGIGASHPDIVNASRRMKKSEFEKRKDLSTPRESRKFKIRDWVRILWYRDFIFSHMTKKQFD